MSDLNVEYVESVVKLGLIEYKKQLLANIGDSVMSDSDKSPFYPMQQIRYLDTAEALIRDSKKLRQIAEQIVKASRE